MNNISKISAYGAFFGTLALLGLSFLDKFAPVQVKYDGFERYSGLTPVACQMDTKGKVTNVNLVDGENYSETRMTDGTLVLEGNFNYRIQPNGDFAPQAESSDLYGHDLDNSDYWSDIRQGSVILAPKSLEAKVPGGKHPGWMTGRSCRYSTAQT